MKSNYKIYLREFKPISNSYRLKKRIVSFNTFRNKFNRLFVGKNSKAGRNFTGSIVVRHKGNGLKKNLTKVDFKRQWSKKVALCLNITKDSNRSSFISLIKYSNGTFSYILSSQGLKPGNFVYTTMRPVKFSFKYTTSVVVIIKYLNFDNIFFNVEGLPGSGGKYSRSAGTFCKLLNLDFDKDLAEIELPSGSNKIISFYCFVTIGRVSNIFHNQQFFTKAGYFRKLGVRPTVRGVAMNPVDHPHGGRTKTSSPEVTPWGKIAKFNK